MASARKGTAADGRTYWRITVSRGRGVPQVTRRWYPEAGWTEKRTARELEKACMQLEQDVAAGKVRTRAEERAEAERHPTLQAWAEGWLESRSELAFSTRETYGRCLRLHVFPLLGDVRLEDVTPAQVSALISTAQTGTGTGTAQLLQALLGTMFRDAVRTGAVDRNPLDRVTPLKVSKEEKAKQAEAAETRALTPAQLETVLNALPEQNPDVRAFVLLGLDAGLRIGEALALQWSAVDWDLGTVTVNGTAQRRTGQGTVITSPKSAAGLRTVAVGAETLEALRTLRNWQADCTGISPWVFAGRDRGTPVSATAARDWLKRLGVPGLHPHQLRHTAATYAILNGADVASVSKRLGHSDIGITLRTYTHPDGEAMAKAGETARLAMGF